MRATGSLLFFRVVALGVMLSGILSVALGALLKWEEISIYRGILSVVGVLALIGGAVVTPLLVFTGGAILYVLVEIAVRLGQRSADSFPRYSRED